MAVRSEIEWRKIIGLRNRIVHDYFNIGLSCTVDNSPKTSK